MPTDDERKYTGVFWRFIQEWTHPFKKDMAVLGFHPVVAEIKWDKDRGGVELTAILMGLGVGMRYNYAETPLVIAERQAMEQVHAYMAQMQRDASHASIN